VNNKKTRLSRGIALRLKTKGDMRIGRHQKTKTSQAALQLEEQEDDGICGRILED
jgi:hypothetical protein